MRCKKATTTNDGCHTIQKNKFLPLQNTNCVYAVCTVHDIIMVCKFPLHESGKTLYFIAFSGPDKLYNRIDDDMNLKTVKMINILIAINKMTVGNI